MTKKTNNNPSQDSISNIQLKDKGTTNVPLSLFQKHFIILPDLTLSRQQSRDITFAFFTDEIENNQLTVMLGVVGNFPKEPDYNKNLRFSDAPVVHRNTNLFAATIHDIDSLIEIDDDTNKVDFTYLRSWIISMFLHRYIKETLLPASNFSEYIDDFISSLSKNKLEWLYNPIPCYSDKKCDLQGFDKCFDLKFFVSPRLLDRSQLTISQVNNESIICESNLKGDQCSKLIEDNEIQLDDFLSELFLYDPSSATSSSKNKNKDKKLEPLIEMSQNLSHHIYCLISLNLDRIDAYAYNTGCSRIRKSNLKSDKEKRIVELTRSYIPGFYYCSNQFIPIDPTQCFESSYNEFIQTILYQTLVKNDEYMDTKKKDELSLPRNFEELIENYYDTAYFNIISMREHKDSLKFYQPSTTQISLEFQPKNPDIYLPLQISITTSAQ